VGAVRLGWLFAWPVGLGEVGWGEFGELRVAYVWGSKSYMPYQAQYISQPKINNPSAAELRTAALN